MSLEVFVDTSAILAVLDADDRHHAAARVEWTRLLNGDFQLVTSNYVVVETFSLVQSRLGFKALRAFHHDITPLFRVIWVDDALHFAGAGSVLEAARRKLSLVDSVSFAVMRRHGLGDVFAFDPHFAESGFSVKP